MNIGSLIEDNIKRFGEYESVYFEGRWYTNAETPASNLQLLAVTWYDVLQF